MSFDKKCFLLIIGALGVGKTNILTRFTKNTFNLNYISTVGVEYIIKDIKLNNQNIHVKIWDISGQERFEQ